MYLFACIKKSKVGMFKHLPSAELEESVFLKKPTEPCNYMENRVLLNLLFVETFTMGKLISVYVVLYPE